MRRARFYRLAWYIPSGFSAGRDGCGCFRVQIWRYCFRWGVTY